MNTQEFLNDLNNHALYQPLHPEEHSDTNHVCFSGGIPVHTERGLVAIQDIKVGDKVLSRDEKTGEESYQLVTKVIETQNQEVYLLNLGEFLSKDKIEERRVRMGQRLPVEYNKEVYAMVTLNHPFWVEGKGWVPVKDLTWRDTLLDIGGRSYAPVSEGFDGTALGHIYKTSHPNIGLQGSYGIENQISGYYIDLSTGQEIDDDELQDKASDEPILSKLYQEDPDWEQDIRYQLGIEDDEPAELYGFKTGYWVNPDELINSSSEQLLATTTVYNLEVANTHTYFVGEHGIWVHNCATRHRLS